MIAPLGPVLRPPVLRPRTFPPQLLQRSAIRAEWLLPLFGAHLSRNALVPLLLYASRTSSATTVEGLERRAMASVQSMALCAVLRITIRTMTVRSPQRYRVTTRAPSRRRITSARAKKLQPYHSAIRAECLLNRIGALPFPNALAPLRLSALRTRSGTTMEDLELPAMASVGAMALFAPRRTTTRAMAARRIP